MSAHLRLTSRVPSALRVDWNVIGRRGHVVSQLRNMSAGGAYIRTTSPAPVGTRVQVKLLTDGGVVPALARVVRTELVGMGVRFEEADPREAPFEVSIEDID